MIEKRLLNEIVTIRKPVQRFVAGTRQPVFGFETVAVGVKARFNPGGVGSTTNPLGKTPKKLYRLFANPVELKENYEVIREADGMPFLVTEVKNFWGHHLEATLEEKK